MRALQQRASRFPCFIVGIEFFFAGCVTVLYARTQLTMMIIKKDITSEDFDFIYLLPEKVLTIFWLLVRFNLSEVADCIACRNRKLSSIG
jgi:hypothetical protein